MGFPIEDQQSDRGVANECPVDSLDGFELVSQAQNAFDDFQEAVVPSSSFSPIVNNSFLSSVPVHDIEMP